ncbi:MAG: HD domain-containing protein [Nitrospirae bacterium]|nr:HD domain-containing protein [Nitrospirota bacterium]
MAMQDKETLRKMLDEHIKNWGVLIDALPCPISIHDTEFNIVLANSAFTDNYGKTDEKDIKGCCIIHGADEPVKDCPIVKTLKSGKKETSEIYEPAFKKHMTVYASPITHENNLIGVIHYIADTAAIKETERSCRELKKALDISLNEAKDKEQSLQKSRDAFLNMLEDINESYKDLEDLFMKFIRAMVSALDAKSPWTKGHSERVASYAEQIAKEMGIEEDEIKDIRLSGLLHDIGKIGTYDYLLDKPSKLTEEEFDIVKKHPAQGAAILKEIKQLKNIIPLIMYHHERVDGKGYPEGIKGGKIPLCARILHAADSFDSMTADRPYRPSPGREYAISELKGCSSTRFDPRVVEAFLRVLSRS